MLVAIPSLAFRKALTTAEYVGSEVVPSTILRPDSVCHIGGSRIRFKPGGKL
jgi:hypothetical protein